MDLTDDKMDDFLFKGLVIVLIVVLGLLLVYSYLQVKPETFTQVYLIPDKIIHETNAGEKVLVEFEIDNREGKTTEYTYTISFEGETLMEKTVSVENLEKKRIIEEVSFSEPTEEKKKVIIEVSREGLEEPYSVWFWIQVN
jgi:uncharacterized membrane protein